MRKGKNVAGKDVVSFIDGAKLHSVKDLIVGPDHLQVIALLIDGGGLLSSAKLIPMENVAGFGKDAVMVSDRGAVIAADLYPAAQDVLDRKDKMVGKKVYTEGGDQVGEVSDIYFDDSTGRVFGLEVSGGLIKNIANGTAYLPLSDVVNIGPDVVLIKSEAVYTLEEQTGGVQGALETAKDKVGDAAGNMAGATKDKQLEFVEGKTASREVRSEDGGVIVSQGQLITRSVAERADQGGKLAALAASASGSMLDVMGQAPGQPPEEAVIGRRVRGDVEADNGSIIVATGQRVSPEDVELARSYGKLDALLAAAGVSQTQQFRTTGGGVNLTQAGDKVGDVAGQVGQQAGQIAGQAGDKGGELWDNFTRRISEFTDSAGKRADEEGAKRRLAQIQDAVGRPVTKVVLDKQDNVILNLGDIITHGAVQRAYDAGMLETLLDNAYKGDVTFGRDEMRAPVEGEATVEKASGNAQVVLEMEQKVEQAQQEREEHQEQKRAEAEQKREEHAQKREQSAQERETQRPMLQSQQGRQPQQPSSSGGGMSQMQSRQPSTSGQGVMGNTLAGTSTEEHVQASIPDPKFHTPAGGEGQDPHNTPTQPQSNTGDTPAR